MLRSLTLRDVVLVEFLELEFWPGMTVLTGETGAGKSILVDALSLVLGDRAESGVIRAGAKRAEISAEFDLEHLPAACSWLAEQGFDEEACVLRRVIESEGRSRAFINGSPATLNQLRELGEELVSVHGQHAHHALLRLPTQRQLLDEFAAAQATARELEQRWRDWRDALARLHAARKASGLSESRCLELEAAITELSPYEATLADWQGFQEEHSRQANMAALIETSARLLALIEEEESGIARQMQAARVLMQELANQDAGLAEQAQDFELSSNHLESLRQGLNRYADRLVMDPERLAEMDRILSGVLRIARRQTCSPEELPAQLADWRAQLQALQENQNIETIETACKEAEIAYRQQADTLSALRKTAAPKLASAVMEIMHELAMAGARFEVTLTDCEPGLHGQEEVSFLVSSHASLPPGTLDKVASGGELSRISLAIQTALSGVAGVPTLIFDEVDVGIGGAVADAVGRRLAQVGEQKQVLVVTHLPQVAAWGRHHLKVSKTTRDTTVNSQVERLSPELRVEEIARMLGGKHITETSLSHARELLAGE